MTAGPFLKTGFNCSYDILSNYNECMKFAEKQFRFESLGRRKKRSGCLRNNGSDQFFFFFLEKGSEIWYSVGCRKLNCTGIFKSARWWTGSTQHTMHGWGTHGGGTCVILGYCLCSADLDVGVDTLKIKNDGLRGRVKHSVGTS